MYNIKGGQFPPFLCEYANCTKIPRNIGEVGNISQLEILTTTMLKGIMCSSNENGQGDFCLFYVIK